MTNHDQEILEDMLCVLMPASSSEPLSDVARHVLDSDWLTEHDRTIAEESWDQGYYGGQWKLNVAPRRLTNPYRKE